MSRKTVIAGNWKMNCTHLEAIALAQKLHYLIRSEDYDAHEIILCPPFTALRAIQTLIDGDRMSFGLGAQHCHWEEKGAYTGEISPAMLAKLHCSHVIVGHSERRTLFGETDVTVNRRARAVLAHGMTPIVCVGETLEEREADATEEVVTRQIRGGLARIAASELARLVIAYEPVWAIGTGRTAQPADANTVCALIRRTLADMGGDEVAAAARIQYGGSVNAGNIADLLTEEDIDGALVGGASLDPEEFALIARARPGR